MSDIKHLQDQIVAFRNERDWKQFHNPKDLALSLTLEAAEVLEHFQWKTPEEIEAYITTNRQDIAEELSDTLYWILLLSHDLEIDLVSTFQQKMEKNAEKYPVAKSKGSHKKYNQL